MITEPILPRLYLHLRGEVCGPYAAEDVQQAVASGEYSGSIPAMIEGLNEWQPVAAVLSSIFPPAGQTSPEPRQYGFGRMITDLIFSAGHAFGSLMLIVIGCLLIGFGIPLCAVLIGFLMIPAGLVCVTIGIIWLFRR